MSEKSSSGVSTVVDVPVASPAGRCRLEFGALTHVGNVRRNNEDQFLVARARKSLDILATSLSAEAGPPPADREGYFLMVADGIGGSAGGERASAILVKEAQRHIMETVRWFFHLDDPDEEVRLRLLREALERVDRQLIEEAEANPALEGMGTTLTGASIIGDELFIVYAGDSRAYLFRDNHLEQLTHDHTLTQELVDRGLVRPEEARTHRLRHVLTNALGGRSGVRGEVVKLHLLAGDRLLLCTDGLSDMVEDAQITDILHGHPHPEEACLALVEAALARGGKDNVTVIVAVYSGSGEGERDKGK
jgi:protein phosphatase